jgi:CelD/BcsL family acetyltransferase involved in cellulose biosynthesis
MDVSLIPVDEPSWTGFVATHPAATAFHLPAWASLIADCYGYEAFALSVRDGSGELVAGLPVIAVRSLLGTRRWSSLPFTDHCPMLVRDGVPLDEIVGALRDYVLASEAMELEVRGDLPPAAPSVYPTLRGYRHVLTLPADPADLKVSSQHRNHRNRAKRLGVEVTVGDSREDVRTFYGLHVLTRRRLGVPVQPRRLFDLIADRLIAPGHGFVATAHFEGQAIASGLYLGYNGTLISKYVASDPRSRELFGGQLVDWEVLNKACLEDYRIFDQGRTDLYADGLRRYKLGWGSVEEPLVYTSMSLREPAPEGVHPGLTRGIIRHSPLWVCRALGALFYRWAA